MALLEGGPETGGLGVASGTSGVFYSIINVAQAGRQHRLGPQSCTVARTPSFTTFCRALASRPSLWIRIIPGTSHSAIDDKTRALFCETVSDPCR